MVRTPPVLLAACLAAAAASCAPSEVQLDETGEVAATSADALRREVRGRAEAAARSPESGAHVLADQELEVRDTVVEHSGSHVRFGRKYRALDVVGGDIVVHLNDAMQLRGVSKTAARPLELSVEPSLTSAQAELIARAHFPAEPASVSARRIVYAVAAEPRLAFDVLLVGVREDERPVELHVIVDANTGALLDEWDDVMEAAAPGAGHGYFSGQVALITNSLAAKGFELRDPSRGMQSTIDMLDRSGGKGAVVLDSDNAFGDGTLMDRASVAVDAQYGAAATWGYFLDRFGRRGIGNDGVGAQSRVHFGRNYRNAFWSDRCFCMTYGDGDGVMLEPFTALDVAAHEMTHGITSRTAGLVYSKESGGLNEATSDIFAALVEFTANNPNDPPDYAIGERIFKAKDRAIRVMWRPSLDGVSADCWYPELGALDVHYSSGVANHFFYLLAEGTSPANLPASPTCESGDTRVATGTRSLAGIGREKAAAIWYRALTLYMTSATTFMGARDATVNAARDLIAQGVLTEADMGALESAWVAVNVVSSPVVTLPPPTAD